MQSARYSYSARPKALPRSSNRIKQILRSGNVEKLEKLIRTGYGYKLIGEYSTDPKIRTLLKAVPFYVARIDMVHEAVAKGHLKDLQLLTKLNSPVYSVLRSKPENLVSSIDSAGAGLLHKAVFYDRLDIIEWLCENFPKTLHVRDKLGRIPLHYVRATLQPDRIWQILVNAGSEVDVEDSNGHSPSYYLANNSEIHLPDRIRYDRVYNEEFTTKPSSIRIWIHEQDIDRLQQVIWEGQGEKLKTQTSNKPLMKRFLNGIPYIMAVVQEIHRAAIQNDVDKLTKYCRKPVPAIILKSKDGNGATALHKACGLGHDNSMDFIVSKYPEAIFARDNEGRTPAHYAAAFRQKHIYEKLLLAGADENMVDKNGRTAKSYNSLSGVVNESTLHEIPPGPRGGIDNVYPSSFDWSLLGDRKYSIERVEEVINSVTETNDINEEISDFSFNIVEKDNDSGIENIPPRTSASERSPKEEDLDNVSETTIEYDVYMSKQEELHTEDNREGEENSVVEEKGIISSPPTFENEGVSDSPSIDEVARRRNLNDIGNSIIDGNYEFLQNMQTDDEQIRDFIDRYLPVYLKKIEIIHCCCEIGNEEELRKYLDRRKFVIARENKSKLYLSPLHVATAYNCQSIVRYLAGAFPETLKVADRLGRTPLHFAAIHPERKYLYNALLTLGADKTIPDESGFTAQYYYENASDDRYEQLMSAIKPRPGISQDEVSTTFLNKFTAFGKPESDYVSAVLGDALKTGLSAIIHARPSRPIKFLADYLHSYKEQKSVEQVSEFASANEDRVEQKEIREEVVESEAEEAGKLGALFVPAPAQDDQEDSPIIEESVVNREEANHKSNGDLANSIDHTSPGVAPIIDFNFSDRNQFHPLDRDKYGQTSIHYAAARTHNRHAFLQKLQEENGNIAFRDELYRTARDVAAFARIYENVQAIDKYVFLTIVNGETEKIMQLITDGYDHIFDLENDTDEDIIEVVTQRGHMLMLAVLRTIPKFQEYRDSLHNAIRFGTKLQVAQILRKCGKDADLLAKSRNYTYRCSLHIAVLVERKDIMKFLIEKFPVTLHMGDNLDRTALHYAMALNKVEQLSRILIQAGANRTAKDLKGRQPSYYFLNKDEILRMRNEELSC